MSAALNPTGSVTGANRSERIALLMEEGLGVGRIESRWRVDHIPLQRPCATRFM